MLFFYHTNIGHSYFLLCTAGKTLFFIPSHTQFTVSLYHDQLVLDIGLFGGVIHDRYVKQKSMLIKAISGATELSRNKNYMYILGLTERNMRFSGLWENLPQPHAGEISYLSIRIAPCKHAFTFFLKILFTFLERDKRKPSFQMEDHTQGKIPI